MEPAGHLAFLLSPGGWLGAAHTDIQKTLPPALRNSKCPLSDLHACVGMEKHISGLLVGNDFPLKLVRE